jgi:hypothetical protein
LLAWLVRRSLLILDCYLICQGGLVSSFCIILYGSGWLYTLLSVLLLLLFII